MTENQAKVKHGPFRYLAWARAFASEIHKQERIRPQIVWDGNAWWTVHTPPIEPEVA